MDRKRGGGRCDGGGGGDGVLYDHGSIEMDCFISGIMQYKDHYVVLAYDAEELNESPLSDDTDHAPRVGMSRRSPNITHSPPTHSLTHLLTHSPTQPQASPRPEIRLLDASFTEVACDLLTINGYQYCQPNDYSLGELSLG